jgi:glutamine synthetase-like protein
MDEAAKHYLANGSETSPDAREAIEWAGETRAKMVDLKFCDLLGTWQHITLPLTAFDESAFDDGLGFDGSSIRGWQGISESDMLLMPDAGSAILDPFCEVPTLSLVCEIADPITKEPYGRDPRRIARRAEEYLRETGRTTSSTPPRATGTPASRGSATRFARRRATSRPLRTTRSTTCAPRWCSRSSGSEFRASSTTTRSPRAGSARSTCATSR